MKKKTVYEFSTEELNVLSKHRIPNNPCSSCKRHLVCYECKEYEQYTKDISIFNEFDLMEIVGIVNTIRDKNKEILDLSVELTKLTVERSELLESISEVIRKQNDL